MKFLSAFVFASFLLFTPLVSAFDQIDFRVENIAQNNQDALRVGAFPGDVLRFDIDVFPLSPAQDTLVVDVLDVQSKGQIIDAGFGEVQGSRLVFPATVGSDMSFFVRINEKCSVNDSVLRVDAEETSVEIPLECEEEATGFFEDPGSILPQTGSQGFTILFLVLAIAIFSLVGVSFLSKEKK